MEQYSNKKLEKLIWDEGNVEDFTFNRRYKPNDLDILKMNLSGDPCFLVHLQSWIKEFHIEEIRRISIHIIQEHFSYDGIPILILEVWINNQMFPVTYIYE